MIPASGQPARPMEVAACTAKDEPPTALALRASGDNCIEPERRVTRQRDLRSNRENILDEPVFTRKLINHATA